VHFFILLKAFSVLFLLFSYDEEDTCTEDQSSQSSARCRCVVRKIPVSRASPQEPNSSDDFVKSRDIRTKKAGAKPPQVPPRTRMKETQQPIKDEKVYASF
jgi:hypothetical protein